MARYTDAVCRLCRREGIKLFLKGDRCYKEKCAIEKRNFAPGQHGKRKGRVKGYGLQLREKQKLKRIYGILEEQFRKIFKKADSMKGITGENLLSLIERRLDNVVFRLGFASSRAQARQLVLHNHILINGKKRNIPSSLVREGDIISLRDNIKENPHVVNSVESSKGKGMPEWLEMNQEALSGKVVRVPARPDIAYPIEEQLIVELYSK